MFSARLRVSTLALVFGLLSGCGGSSSGNAGNGTGSGGSNPPPPPPPTTITFTVTGPAPTAVATQIGAGSFTAATLSSSGALTLTLPNGTTNFAVAFVCPASSSTNSSSATQQTNEYVYEASTADGSSFGGVCPSTSTSGTTGTPTGTSTGTVDASAIPGAAFLDVDAWNGNSEATGYASVPSSSFSFAAPQGSDTVNVVAYSSTLQDNYAEVLSMVAARSFSGQTVPGALNGGNPVVLGTGDETIPEPITYSGIPTGFSAPSTVALYSDPGVAGYFLTNSAGTQYPGLPAGAVLPGGFYQFNSATFGNINVTPYQEVSQEIGVNKSLAEAGPLSITFPTPWAYTGPTPAPLPAFDMSGSGISATGSSFNAVGLLWPISGQAETGYYLQIAATANYMNTGTTITVPDLSSMSGFLGSPSSGQSVAWYASVYSGDFPSGSSLSSTENVSFVQNSGLYNLP
jgi:hypothetical protein